jgi:hypothetical protein
VHPDNDVGAKDHELLVDADLRGSEAGAVHRLHGLEHVAHEQVQRIGVECGHGLRDAQQARVAHLQDLANGHAALSRALLQHVRGRSDPVRLADPG